MSAHRHEVLELPNVFSPTSLRVRRSSTAVNGCSSRDGDDLGRGDRPDPGQRVELRGRRLVEVERSGAASRRRRARRCPRSTRPRVVPRRDADLVAVMRAVRRGSGRGRHARRRPADRSRRQRPRGRRSLAPAAGGRRRDGRPRRRSRRRAPCQSTLQVVRPGSRARGRVARERQPALDPDAASG